MAQPETMTYKAGLRRSLVLAVIFSAMGYAGYLGVLAGAQAAWFAVGLGALGVAAAILRILPGSTDLQLTVEGVTFRALYRTTFIPWADIKEFDTASPRPFVHHVVYRLTESRKGAMNRAARSLMAYDGAIPPEYGVGHEALLAILQDYHKQIPQTSAEYTAPLTLEEQIQADRQRGKDKRLKPKPVMIFTALILLILAALNHDLVQRSFTGAKAAVSGGMDQTFNKVYREKFMKECLNGDASESQVKFCECCVEATLAKFSREQLMKSDPTAIADMEKNILPVCAEKFLDAGGDDAEKTVEEEPDGAKPEPNKLTQKLEAAIASRPKPVIVKPDPAPEPIDIEGLSSVYLTNGQVMSCRVLSRDKKGIWVDVGGGKAYFGNSEIKKITSET